MTSASSPRPGITTVLDVARLVVELFAVVSLGVWGFIAWPLPWNIVIGIGAPVLAVVLWALFRSPKAVLRVDLFVKAVVEIAVYIATAFAWWDLGQPVVAVVFTVVAVTLGVWRGRRELR